MGLNKYKGFIPGQKLPAENVNSIDPENIDPRSAGYLTGGTGHSALSVFQALANGANDGKIKINIDGTVYDNLALDLTITNTESTLINQLSGTSATAGGPTGQSFTLSQKTKIKSLSAYFNSTPSSASARIRVGKSMTSEIVGESTSVVLGSPTTFTFGDGVVLEAGTYTFEMKHATGYIYFTTSNPYSGGDAFIQGSWRSGYDIKFSVIAATIDIVSSLDEIANFIQSAIRTAIGSLETVVYDTDHFVITSAYAGSTSQILKLMTPTSGTDISGAGATAYLDCADNATETLGTGEDFNLVRLNENGKLPIEILSPIRAIASNTLRASADTERSRGNTETTPTKMKEISTEYGGILRVKFEGKGQSGSQQHAQIYKNGVAFGTLRTFTDATYREYSGDLLFEKGDLIQLYLWVSFSNSSYRAYGKNFRVYFDLQKGDEANTNLD